MRCERTMIDIVESAVWKERRNQVVLAGAVGSFMSRHFHIQSLSSSGRVRASWAASSRASRFSAGVPERLIATSGNRRRLDSDERSEARNAAAFSGSPSIVSRCVS